MAISSRLLNEGESVVFSTRTHAKALLLPGVLLLVSLGLAAWVFGRLGVPAIFGVFTRTGHDIPLNRISDVSYERDLIDRILGCGTLVISDASEVGRVALPDVPRVEQLQLQLSELLYNMHNARSDDGT